MNDPKGRIYNPIKRSGAEYYLLLILFSFAASVTLTRTFLYLTGYPQLGSGGLHIAHVIWGGLILFVASLLPLIFANRWLYSLSAILAGVGIGLFIDEVGKFVTQENNYFYPPAATIIYTFFLLVVLVYVQVRKSPRRSPRYELYQALDTLEDILDHDLDASEKEDLEKRLNYVSEQSDSPHLARLARELLEYLASDKVNLVPASPPNFLQNALVKAQALENQYITRTRLRAFLVFGVGVLGLVALSKIGQTLVVGIAPGALERSLSNLIEMGILTHTSSLYWFLARVILEGSLGLMLIASAILLGLGKDHLGIWGSYFSLLISLTAVNLLLFYFEQFSMIATASFQLLIFLTVLHYRRKYLLPTVPLSGMQKESST